MNDILSSQKVHETQQDETSLRFQKRKQKLKSEPNEPRTFPICWRNPAAQTFKKVRKWAREEEIDRARRKEWGKKKRENQESEKY